LPLQHLGVEVHYISCGVGEPLRFGPHDEAEAFAATVARRRLWRFLAHVTLDEL
jgi:hypothetical protein